MKKKNAFIAIAFGLILPLAVVFNVQTISYHEQIGRWAGSMGSLITSYVSPLAKINYQSLVPGSIAKDKCKKMPLHVKNKFKQDSSKM